MRRSKKNIAFNKVSNKDRNEIIYDLVYAIVNCRTINESAVFIEDILTESELEFISRRLRIAKLLIDEDTYEDIIIKSLPKEKISHKDPLQYSSWSELKRKYPTYFLPERIIEQIVSMASKKQKEHLIKVISELDSSLKEKSQLHRNIELLLKS